MSTSLERHRSRPITEAARFDFDSEQIAAIRRTVAKDCNESELVMFLEIAGRYALDPFAKHIYAAKMPGRDGAAGSVALIVSRDGLLKLANDRADFQGMTGDVVRAGDILRREGETFTHSYEGTADDRDALDIVGAWAKVRRRDREPTFFYARMASYKGTNKVWTKYPDAMILKCAESMALRKAFSISGLVPEDEVGVRYDDDHGAVFEEGEGTVVEQEPDWGPDEELAEKLRLLVDAANELREGAYRKQKMRVTLAGADEAKRRQIAHDLATFVVSNGGTLPWAEEPVEGEVVDEET